MTALHDDAVRTVSAYADPDAGQQALREAFLGFLASNPGAMLRPNEPGHLTASAIVVRPDDGALLLTLHPRVGRWVQVGGHCEESDASLAAAALREATEESGVAGLVIDPALLHLDVHPITCSLGLPTRHFDARFLVTAPRGAHALISDESLDLRWFTPDALPPGTDPTIGELGRRAASRLAAAQT